MAAELDRPDGWSNGALLTQPVTTPAPQDHDTDGGDRAPATPVEQILADIYAQVLGLSHVGVDESFFDLGGDSLSAMRVIAAINTALDTQLALPTLLDTPSIANLTQQLNAQTSPVAEVPAVSPASDL